MRRWLRNVAERVHVSDRNPDFAYLRPDRTFTNKAYFGRDDIRVIHRLFETVIQAPTRRFAKSILGIRFQILAHFRWK